ncbi:MAG TPA: AMP-binding protein [Pseudonocardiaceae bacterium]|nr:AMP-binding protein [Pseudonocardiaceae bacterium]
MTPYPGPDGFRVPEGSIVSVFAGHRHQHPGAVACHDVRADGDTLTAVPLTYAELDHAAARARARLIHLGLSPGDRVALAVENPHALLAWFLATMVCQVLAVPLPAAHHAGGPVPARNRGVCDHCRPTVIVTDDPDGWRAALGTGLAPHLISADLATGPYSAAQLSLPTGDIAPDAPAYLQYTSGSTRSPSGVVITHRNLMANLEAIHQALAFTEADKILSWLPLYHDMGLVGGLLAPLYSRIGGYCLSPTTFLRRPVTWLRGIQQFRATTSVAPPSAYSLCLRHLTDTMIADLDLSSWRRALLGAEPIDPDLPARFHDRFRRYGLAITALMPVYGLAEVTLAAAFPPLGQHPRSDTVDRHTLATGRAMPSSNAAHRSTTFLSVGIALPGHHIRILDPRTHHECPERHIGEITVTGPSVSPNDYGEDPIAARTLHTGDLGYLADGQLYIVDRIKDLIIIAGRNYYPADIEAALADFPDIKGGRVAALAVPTSYGTEGLGLIIEVSHATCQAGDAVKSRINRVVQQQFGITPTLIYLGTRNTIPRTTSGKIQRSACRALLAGTSQDLSPAGGAQAVAVEHLPELP